MRGRSRSSKLHSAGWPDDNDHNRTQTIYKTRPQSRMMCLRPLSGFRSHLQFPQCIITSFSLPCFCQPLSSPISPANYIIPPLSVGFYTHGPCVHKAASGACCCRFRSGGPKRGTAPPAGHCRCPRTRWCCTSGTDRTPPSSRGLRWLAWEGLQGRGQMRHWKCLFGFTLLGFYLKN